MLPIQVLAKEAQNETPGAAATVKRLLEAETQAQEILKAAEARAREAVARAREEAAKILESAREQSALSARDRLDHARAGADAEVKRRIDLATLEARELQRRAGERLPEAVEAVVRWVTRRSG